MGSLASRALVRQPRSTRLPDNESTKDLRPQPTSSMDIGNATVVSSKRSAKMFLSKASCGHLSQFPFIKCLADT